MYLDFVANHAAVDSLQVKENKQLFVNSEKVNASEQYENGVFYGKDHYNDYWTDTL